MGRSHRYGVGAASSNAPVTPLSTPARRSAEVVPEDANESASRPRTNDDDATERGEIQAAILEQFRDTAADGALIDELPNAMTVGGRDTAGDEVVWDAIAFNDRDAIADSRVLGRQRSSQSLNAAPLLRVEQEADVATPVAMFLKFLPVDWMKRRMLPAMSQTAVVGGQPHTFSFAEVLELLGVLMYFAMFHHIDKFTDLWSTAVDNCFRQIPHPMARNGVVRDRVLRTMRYFGCISPSEMDHNHPAKGFIQLVDAFNTHWQNVFRPGPRCCLDESCVSSGTPRDYLRVCFVC